MNIDFHVHGLLSKKSYFNEELFLNGIETAKEQGIDGIILCEHFNSDYILSIYKYLEEHYEYEGDRYIVNGVSIFIGMEVDIYDGGHVIISGNREVISIIRNELSDYMIKPNFIELDKLIKLGEQYNCLMIGSHPYRESHKLYLQSKYSLSRLDGIDLNATDIFTKGLDVAKSEVNQLSKEINVPFITGSDSHYPIQLGSVYTNFDKELNTVKEIKEAIFNREFTVHISKSLNLKVLSSKISKAYIKGKLIYKESEALEI